MGPSYRETAFDAVEAQPDGSVLARRDGGIWRYRADGSFDTGFPRQQAPPPEVRAIQSDGKILTVESRAYPIDSRLLRAEPDGSSDPGFAGASVPISISQILPLSSGRILVAGSAVYENLGKGGTVNQVALARFESNGALDPSFGENGVVRLRTDYGIEGGSLNGIGERPGEASVVLAGTSLIGLDGSGGIDSGYGSGGTVSLATPPFGFHSAAGGGLLLVEAAPHFCCESGGFALARYTASGALDPSFGGGDGHVDSGFAGTDQATGVLWGDDGSVLVGGSLITPPAGSKRCLYPLACHEVPTLARFTSSGLLDPSFGVQGRVKLDPLGSDVAFLGVTIQGVRALDRRPGGGIFAGGGAGPGTSVAFLAALRADGSLDPSFGTNGIVRERDPSPSWSEAGDVAVARDGRILLGGATDAGPEDGSLAVARYRRNGSLDSSFGGGSGFVSIPTPLGEAWQLDDLALTRRGLPIVLYGEATVIRLTRTGKVDTSFGAHGSASPGEDLHALFVLPSGRVLVAGSVSIGRRRAVMVVFRLLANGRLDHSFGRRGIATVGFGRKGRAGARQIAVQSDGRILLAGYAHGSMAVARLMPNGRIDRSFGHRGEVVPPVGRKGGATAVAVQGGKILLAGWTERGSKVGALLLRYSHEGRLDRRFARRGVAAALVAAPGRQGVQPRPIRILLTRRRIVVVRTGRARPLLTYRRDGSPDRFFGHSLAIAPNRISGPVGAMQDGQIILAWNAAGANGQEFALQRVSTR